MRSSATSSRFESTRIQRTSASYRVRSSSPGAKLRATRPYVFYLSDLEVSDLLRLKDPAATEFVRTLSEVYSGAILYKRPPTPFAGLAPGRTWAPPDWLYPSPEITLYHNFDTDHVTRSF